MAVMLFTAVGCSGKDNNFNVSGQSTDAVTDKYNFTTVEDIENLVTDDERLVINYFDAYIWIVYFDDDGNIDHMVYIYEFTDETTASSMVEKRCAELEQNKSMTVLSSYSVGNYVLVDLTDISFTNVTRAMLENNFSGLVVN